MKFTEAKLEDAFIALLQKQGFDYVSGNEIKRSKEEVLLKGDLRSYLDKRYASEGILPSEIDSIIRQIEILSASDLYDSNKAFMNWLCNGFVFKREKHDQKDIYIQLLDFETQENNDFKVVNQLEIEGDGIRIPDVILYVNGLPLVVIELKSASREEATLHNAYEQITIRYKRDIPELLKYNAFCIISDASNSKAGSLFAPYEFFYSWRRTNGLAKDVDGIESMYTMIEGMLDKGRLLDIIHYFIYLPDSSKQGSKIVCRYPQYYAANALFDNILQHQRPQGDGKGGTYFGATGCGKSFTMLFLTRMLMRSQKLSSPTIILITDRTDLDEQLSKQFTNAKTYIGDDIVQSVGSRSDLRSKLEGRKSGGVFLTTIHKFNEDTEVLTQRTNVICISDEAHRSQVNLDQKLTVTDTGVKKSYGFAKHLHDSLPNATYVGFTGTPVDATLDVFGQIVDSYTMTESVKDEITVSLAYEGRSAKVVLNNQQLADIERYYDQCAAEGATEYHIDKSKMESASMAAILGDNDRLDTLADDFINHYETRIEEGSTVKGKALFVCSSRSIAYAFYQKLIEKRPEWAEVKPYAEDAELTEEEKEKVQAIERVKMIMTRGKDDPEDLYKALGDKDYRKALDRQFKDQNSNFKIAIVVDMWLTGFDVPFLDTIYIDKPLQRHNLIQTISRVNRTFAGKNKGLVVDYIGIKKDMNLALAMYNETETNNFEDVEKSVVIVKDHLDLLAQLFHNFDSEAYFGADSLQQLDNLKLASEFVLSTEEKKKRFMDMVKRLKSAYDICVGSEGLNQNDRDHIHYYLAIRSIVYKLTKGDAPDTAQMNARVKELVTQAIESDGIQEILQLGEDEVKQEDIFSDDYLDKLSKIKLPNTKIQLLQKLLAKAIGQLKKVNKMQGVNFTKKMQSLVNSYNERRSDSFPGGVLGDVASDLIELLKDVKNEFAAGDSLGIDFEEKAFYDILKTLAHKYDFDYPKDKLIYLAQKVKEIVDDKSKYTDWSKRDDIKAALKAELIVLLAENDYPPVDHDEVYKEIFEQAENFKKNRK